MRFKTAYIWYNLKEGKRKEKGSKVLPTKAILIVCWSFCDHQIQNNMVQAWWAKSLLVIVRTSFGLDTKTGMDSGPTSPNNKFVECGRKN